MNNKKQIFAQIGTMLVLLGVFGVFEGAGSGTPGKGSQSQPFGAPTSFAPGGRGGSKTATVAAPGGPAGSTFTPAPLPPKGPPITTQPPAPITSPPAMPPSLSMKGLKTTTPDAAPADGGSASSSSTGSAPINPAPGFGGTVEIPPVLNSLQNAMKVSVGAHVIVLFDNPEKGGFQGNDFRSKILQMMLYLKDQDATILDGLEAKEFPFNNTKDLGGDGEVIKLTKDSTKPDIENFVERCFPDFNDKGKRIVSEKHRADLNDVQYKLKEKISGMDKNSGTAQVLRVLIDLMEGYSALDIYAGIGKGHHLDNSKTLSAAGQMAISAARNKGDAAFTEIIKKKLETVMKQYGPLFGEITIDEEPDFNKMISVAASADYAPILRTALELAQGLLDKNLRYIIGERCPVVTDIKDGTLVARLDEERCAYRNGETYWEADFVNGVVSRKAFDKSTEVFKKDDNTASKFTEDEVKAHKLRIYGLYYQLSALLQNDTSPSSKDLTVLNNLLLDLDVNMVKKDFDKAAVLKSIQDAIDSIASTKINPKGETNIKYGELLYTLLFAQCVLSHLEGSSSGSSVENFIKRKALDGQADHAYDKLFEIVRKALAEFSVPLWTLTQYFKKVERQAVEKLNWYEASVKVYRHILGEAGRDSAKKIIQEELENSFAKKTAADAAEAIMKICEKIRTDGISDSAVLEEFSKALEDINAIAIIQKTGLDKEKEKLADAVKDFAETSRLVGSIDKIGDGDDLTDATTTDGGSAGSSSDGGSPATGTVRRSSSGRVMLGGAKGSASSVLGSSSSVGGSSSDVARSLVEQAAAGAISEVADGASSVSSRPTTSVAGGSQAGAATFPSGFSTDKATREAAATTIQAGKRGMDARTQVRELKKSPTPTPVTQP